VQSTGTPPPPPPLPQLSLLPTQVPVAAVTTTTFAAAPSDLPQTPASSILAQVDAKRAEYERSLAALAADD
jgi:hypothetical protein